MGTIGKIVSNSQKRSIPASVVVTNVQNLFQFIILATLIDMKVANNEPKLLHVHTDKLSPAMYALKPQLKEVNTFLGVDIPREILLSDRNDSDTVSVASSLAPAVDTDVYESSKRKYQYFMKPLTSLPPGRPLSCPPGLPVDLLKSSSKGAKRIKLQRSNASVQTTTSSSKKMFVNGIVPNICTSNCLAGTGSGHSRRTIAGFPALMESRNSLSNDCGVASTDASYNGSNSTVASAVEEYIRMPPSRHSRITFLSLLASHLMDAPDVAENKM